METETITKNKSIEKFLIINVIALILWALFAKFVSINMFSLPYAEEGSGFGVLIFIAISGIALCVISFVSLLTSILALENLKKTSSHSDLESIVKITSKSLIVLTSISWLLFYIWIYTIFAR